MGSARGAQQHERNVRPRGLAPQDVRQLLQIAADHLFGQDDHARRIEQFVGQRSQRTIDPTRQPALADDAGNALCVAPERRNDVDDGPVRVTGSQVDDPATA